MVVSEPGSAAAMAEEAPKRQHPSFLRLLYRSAASQKHGLAVVVLSTSCLFLSLSMLHHKRRNEDLLQHLSSLQHDNDSLRQTIAAASDIVFSSSPPPPPPPPVASPTTDLPASPATGGSGFMV